MENKKIVLIVLMLVLSFATFGSNTISYVIDKPTISYVEGFDTTLASGIVKTDGTTTNVTVEREKTYEEVVTETFHIVAHFIVVIVILIIICILLECLIGTYKKFF